jgi:hypothetical protein
MGGKSMARQGAAVTAVASRLALAILTLGCANASRYASPTITRDTTPGSVIPFQLYDGRINIRAAVNGDSGWLILDSGARTGLDRAWARQRDVRFPWAPDTSYAVVDSIQFPHLILRNYALRLYDTHKISEASGRSVAGLLGDDFLRHFTVEVDYGAQVVRLHERATFNYAGSGIVLPFVAEGTYPLVHASMGVRGGNSADGRLLLDTGSGRLCLILLTPFVEQHNLTTAVTPVIEGPLVTGIVGPLHIAVGTVTALQFGGLTVESVPSGFGRERRSFLAATSFDGLLGNRLFQGSRLIFDYARHRAIVEPGVGLGRECTYDHSGLVLSAHGDDYRDFRVDYVIPHSPASEAGIQAEDRLLTIDRRAATEIELPELRQLLSTAGAVRRLSLLRGADTIVGTLKLRRLF